MSVAAVASAGAAIAAPAAAQDRTVTDPVTGEVVEILNEGNCSALQVNQSRTGDTTSTLKHLEYVVNSDCTVTVATGTTGGAPMEDSPNAVGQSETAAQDSADAGGYTYNWAWSSQTLQDIISIDIAKLKFTTRRGFNQSYVYLTNLRATSSTSVSWNHTDGKPYFHNYNWDKASSTSAKASAKFHSDFLWCNFEPGQNFIMTSMLKSYASGGKDRSYSQNRQCAGTHKATESGVSSSQPF